MVVVVFNFPVLNNIAQMWNVSVCLVCVLYLMSDVTLRYVRCVHHKVQKCKREFSQMVAFPLNDVRIIVT